MKKDRPHKGMDLFQRLIQKVDAVWEWVIKFVTLGIWDDSVYRKLSVKNAMAYVTRIIYILVNRFVADKIGNKASALTYSTLLSIIPILAILFGIARGFGFDHLLRQQIEVGFGNQTQTLDMVFEFVDSYLSQTQGGVFLGVGLFALLWSFISLVNNMEGIFNDIWYVKKERSIYRKLTDYFSLLLLMPLLIIASGGLSIFMTTWLKDIEGFTLLAPLAKFAIRLIPFALSCLMFTGLYIFMPNTRVRLIHALVPGFMAGTAFQLFQYLYIGGQLWVSKYNAIYGSFAALPLFMLWMQVSWTICILGAELTYIEQNFNRYDNYKEVNNASHEYRMYIAVLLMSMICKQYRRGGKLYSARKLSNMCRIPIQLTQQMLNELCDAKLVILNPAEKRDEEFYVPGSGYANATVASVVERLGGRGFSYDDFKVDYGRTFGKSYRAMQTVKQAALKAGNIPLSEL